jgi:hypothetical protein
MDIGDGVVDNKLACTVKQSSSPSSSSPSSSSIQNTIQQLT